jgi:hypothetical protein
MIAEGIPHHDIWLPAIEFHRAQISNFLDENLNVDSSKIKYKDRSVWGEDAASVAIQGQYARVLIDACRLAFVQYAGGKSSKYLRNFIRYYCYGKYWVSTDMSKYDQSVPAWLLSKAFELIRLRFPESCEEELKWIEYDFIHKKIIGYDGKLWSKEKGIPSGNYFTQIVGSLCNLLMICTFLASKCGGSVEERKAYIAWELLPKHCGRGRYLTVIAMGDDNIVFTRKPFPLSEYATYAKRNFGMTINVEKSSSGCAEAPEFLKREWTEWGEWREPLEFFIQLTHPENERGYEKEGYTEWHILYGLYLTYQPMMSKYFTEAELVERMAKSGVGLDSLLTLGRSSRQQVPGSLRMMSDADRHYLYERAQRIAASLAA